MDISRLVSARSRAIDASGIRRVFDLAAKLKDPINLSIGQPDFPVPDAIKNAAIQAISNNANGYTVTQGIPALRNRLAKYLADDVGWSVDPKPAAEADKSKPGVLVTVGTSGGLYLALLALLDPGDELIIPDPYFVMYPHVCTMVGAKAVYCDTYPDFRMTAARVEPLITPRTKAVLLNTPGNPTGVVASQKECRELLELCRSRNILLISDEIYEEFTYPDAREQSPVGDKSMRCPSPGREPGSENDVLLVRGFGKTYGFTGWRMGYVAGPRTLIEEMSKLQQYTYVCAPAPLQHGAVAALDVDMHLHIEEYLRRRDLVVSKLKGVTNVPIPGGAFYAFPEVPKHAALNANAFVEIALKNNMMVIPGNVFSRRDTNIRISFATDQTSLTKGLDLLADLFRAK